MEKVWVSELIIWDYRWYSAIVFFRQVKYNVNAKSALCIKCARILPKIYSGIAAREEEERERMKDEQYCILDEQRWLELQYKYFNIIDFPLPIR